MDNFSNANQTPPQGYPGYPGEEPPGASQWPGGYPANVYPQGQPQYGQQPLPGQQPGQPYAPQAAYTAQPPAMCYAQSQAPQGAGADAIKEAKRRSRPWTLVFIVALTVFILSVSALVYILYTYQSGEASYEELDRFVQVPVVADADDLSSFDIDWDGLRAINPDIVGWVYLPGTIIDYPIVWRKDGGQEYYMTHNFQGHSFEGFGAEYGCPVLADVNSPDWNDQISFVAGHHMWNDTMFSFLESMVNSETFNQNRTFYLLTPKGNFKLNAIACDRISQYSKETVIPNFGTREEFMQYMFSALESSLVDPEPPAPSVSSLRQIIALYTCSNANDNYRIMVYCRVERFLPAGSKVSKENALIDEESANEIKSSVEERVQ